MMIRFINIWWNESLETLDDAWQIVFAYARRWEVEMALRFEKAELGMRVRICKNGKLSANCGRS